MQKRNSENDVPDQSFSKGGLEPMTEQSRSIVPGFSMGSERERYQRDLSQLLQRPDQVSSSYFHSEILFHDEKKLTTHNLYGSGKGKTTGLAPIGERLPLT
jgi:hypothetical protein